MSVKVFPTIFTDRLENAQNYDEKTPNTFVG